MARFWTFSNFKKIRTKWDFFRFRASLCEIESRGSWIFVLILAWIVCVVCGWHKMWDSSRKKWRWFFNFCIFVARRRRRFFQKTAFLARFGSCWPRRSTQLGESYRSVNFRKKWRLVFVKKWPQPYLLFLVVSREPNRGFYVVCTMYTKFATQVGVDFVGCVNVTRNLGFLHFFKYLGARLTTKKGK